MAIQAHEADLRADGRQDLRLTRALRGRFTLADRREHRCLAIDVSPSGAALETTLPGDVGQHIVCYLDDLGRVEGRIVRLFEAGFAVAFSSPPGKREKLEQHIAMMAERPAADEAAVFRGERQQGPAEKRAILRLANGRGMRVQVLDLTARSAAVICPAPVAIGTSVSLDGRPARVVRVAQLLVGLAFAADA